MEYTATVRLYRRRGGPNGWQETVTITMADAAPPETYMTAKAWIDQRVDEWVGVDENTGWRVLDLKIETC